jgi:hypothetical protein
MPSRQEGQQQTQRELLIGTFAVMVDNRLINLVNVGLDHTPQA